MIRELKIILPMGANSLHVTDTSAPSDALDVFRSNILGAFGGFTEQPVSGAWRDPVGVVHVDRNILFTIASEWTEDTVRGALNYARQVGEAMGQQSVYAVRPHGRVVFIECDPAAAVTDAV